MKRLIARVKFEWLKWRIERAIAKELRRPSMPFVPRRARAATEERDGD